jgi:putative transposase
VGAGKKGVAAGACRVVFLDESGFGLWLPLAYSWTAVGTVRGVPRGGGRMGRVNVIGHLDWQADGAHRIGFAVVSGSCRTEVVVRYLDELAQEGARRGVPTVVYLDNASFHRSQDFRRCWERWLACGLRVRYLPCYSPHLNLMETVWRRVKGGLMPRRYYEDVASLRAAVVAGLKQLGGEELKI